MFNSINSGAAAYLTSGANATNLAAKTTTKSAAQTEQKDPVSEFLAYQKLTPQQKIRDAYLKRYGLTEESLAQLSPAKRKQIEEEIRKEILQEMKGKMAEKGVILDISA